MNNIRKFHRYDNSIGWKFMTNVQSTDLLSYRNTQKYLSLSFCLYFILFVMRCTIWYHLYNFKNVKNAHGEVLLLVKLQAALGCNFTKSNTPPWVFFTFSKLGKWYQIAQRITFCRFVVVCFSCGFFTFSYGTFSKKAWPNYNFGPL